MHDDISLLHTQIEMENKCQIESETNNKQTTQ